MMRVGAALIALALLSPIAGCEGNINDDLIKIAVTFIASISTTGVTNNTDSDRPILSDDGRYVAFESWGSNLAPPISLTSQHVFRHDNQTGETILISAPAGGTVTPNSSSYQSSLSQDGRFVAFTSEATNMQTSVAESSWYADIYVSDTQTGSITLATVNPGGTVIGNFYSQWPSVVSDGTNVYVAFMSGASNLTTSDSNGTTFDVFVRQMPIATLGSAAPLPGATVMASVDPSGASAGNSSSYTGAQDVLAIDGTSVYVSFYSNATNLTTLPASGQQMYHRTIPLATFSTPSTGTTLMVSVDTTGNQSSTTGGAESPSISPDGRYVAFTSWSSDLVASDTNGSYDVFLRDTLAGSTERVSLSASGAQLSNASYRANVSSNGARVVFESDDTAVVSGDTNGSSDIFMRNRTAGTTIRVSLRTFGEEPNSGSRYGTISADGTVVSFVSWANNLVDGDTNNAGDAFIRKY